MAHRSGALAKEEAEVTATNYVDTRGITMNHEEFNATLNRIGRAQNPTDVEACVMILHALTDHGLTSDRVKAEEAIYAARRRVGALPDPKHQKANDIQVAGDHYRTPIQHWDYVIANDLGYFEGQITKYVTRWRKKNGLQDLRKAQHFLNKLIESEEKKL